MSVAARVRAAVLAAPAVLSRREIHRLVGVQHRVHACGCAVCVALSRLVQVGAVERDGIGRYRAPRVLVYVDPAHRDECRPAVCE